MGTDQTPLDMPLIVEATNEFYRRVYADGILGPIFKGLNMIVLRRHISYFVYELIHCETPMTELQVEHLRQVHNPMIAERDVNQHHFDILVSMLIGCLRESGAQGQQLLLVQKKLRPFREVFPSQASNSVDGVCLLQDQLHHSSSQICSGHSYEHIQQRQQQPPAAEQVGWQQPAQVQREQEQQPALQRCPSTQPQLELEQQKQQMHIRANHKQLAQTAQAGPVYSGAAACSCVQRQLPPQRVTAAMAASGCGCKDPLATGDQLQQCQVDAAQSPKSAPVGCLGCQRNQQQLKSSHAAGKSGLWWQRLLSCANGF